MLANNANLIVTYTAWISAKGRLLIEAWMAGSRVALQTVLSGPVGKEEGR